MVVFPDYVNALGISADDVQFETTDHSGNLVFNLLTHETWIEAEPAFHHDASTLAEHNAMTALLDQDVLRFNSDNDNSLC